MTGLDELRREQAQQRRAYRLYVLGTVVATCLYFWALAETGALFLANFPH